MEKIERRTHTKHRYRRVIDCYQRRTGGKQQFPAGAVERMFGTTGGGDNPLFRVKELPYFLCPKTIICFASMEKEVVEVEGSFNTKVRPPGNPLERQEETPNTK